jgi:electron transfer flavoprotein alpha subunit
MSIVVFAESSDNQFKKSTFEAISYAKEIGTLMGKEVVAVNISSIANSAELGKYGASKVLNCNNTDGFTSDSTSEIFASICKQIGASIVVVSNSYVGKSLAPRIAVSLNASLATNVISVPDLSNGFTVKRGVFSGKAFAFVNLNRDIKVLAITPNSFEINANGSDCATESISVNASPSKITINAVNKVTGKIPLTEAELVVSAGRGMKGPENWNMIEELASLIGAATACSKPVSDMGWRPHSEHVGQTGITIKPNLYIAIGISGAIQHLAGVSSSKTIVAINKDPEAPFFKSADYGIVGDAFEILPKLISALKN